MLHTNKVLYSPYGAFELKSHYQRNLSLSTALITILVVISLFVAWIFQHASMEEEVPIQSILIQTVVDLGPPPSVISKSPQVQVSLPDATETKVGIPIPVADEEIIDENVVIPSLDELAEIVPPDITSLSDDKNIIVEIPDKDYLDDPSIFVPVEIRPVMIYEHLAVYPRLAKQAGLTGIVWVNALVDEEGNVLKANVRKSSGVKSLDDAAIEAALKCRYSPAIQNNRPVKLWVTYSVEFEFTDG